MLTKWIHTACIKVANPVFDYCTLCQYDPPGFAESQAETVCLLHACCIARHRKFSLLLLETRSTGIFYCARAPIDQKKGLSQHYCMQRRNIDTEPQWN
eukprot:COSAG02_NODE_4857_length_4897_cov_5.098166_6_plen_98_part_00